MRGLLYIALSIFCLYAFTCEVMAADGIFLHGQYGWFNREYRDLSYKGNPPSVFSVPMMNAGFEYHQTRDGDVFGFGYAGAQVSEGKKYNVDHYETQPSFYSAVPYVFIGHDFRVWAMELGMSYYLSFIKSEPRYYLNQDGSERRVNKSESTLDRNESYVFPNFLIRIFNENRLHIKLRFGRERFHVIDSLFNAGVVYPYENHSWELYLSIPLRNSDYFPRCNQQIGVVYSYTINQILLGATIGYLTYNSKGGGKGDMTLMDVHNLSFGFIAGFKYK